MRSWKEALEWLRKNNTAGEIGFDPDGMCLKITRSARDIAARFLTAKQAQDATPREHRVYRVADLRKGMALYFDDPNDSNTAGHIVTMMGRVRNPDVNSLHDILVKTNSVKENELVTVRADYFGTHWHDNFQFGATWLNGVELDVPAKKVQEPIGAARLENFKDTRGEWDVKILDRMGTAGMRNIKSYVARIDRIVAALPDDLKDTRVKEFKNTYNKRRVLKMKLLNDAVKDGRMQAVKNQRDRLNMVIKRVLR